MGKLTVEGSAKKEVKADIMEINITFKSISTNSYQSIGNAVMQCEKFLSKLSKMNFDMSYIRMDKDNTQKYNYSNKDTVTTIRSIKIEMPFDLNINNAILQIIQDNKYDIDYNVVYKISNLKDIHNELLKEAIQNSRERAELIAETMNQKIVGIDTLNLSEKNKYEKLEMTRGISNDYRCASVTPFSDKLGTPTKSEEENLSVVWVME